MVRINLLTDEQAKYAIENLEFENSLLNSNENVVIILTQDWCPQWKNMKSWLSQICLDKDVDIFYFEYNRSKLFNEFIKFKEKSFCNYEVPYLRFYKNGSLVKESNYTNKDKFTQLLQH